MTNNEMLLNLIDQYLLGMIPEDDKDMMTLHNFLSHEGGDRHAEYQGDWSRWVDLTPEQRKQAYENMVEE